MFGWVACALFRLFVVLGIGYGIYSLISGKIGDVRREKYIKECQDKHQQEMEEAKKRISKAQNKK